MPTVPLPAFSRLTRVALVFLALIVVTGGAVRLTGSGLGCPTWPECGNGSFVTRPEFELHGLIEFGNRAVTAVVGLLVLALPLVALRLDPGETPQTRARRRDLVLLGFGLWIGYVGQAVLGGLTVLFHLNPALVAGHFLLSMALLLDVVLLDVRARRAPVAHRALRPELRALGWVLTTVAGAVLVLGTVVTGSGPHSGDSQDLHRFGFDVRSVAQLHADGAMLLTGLIVVALLALRLGSAPRSAQRTGAALLAVVVGQAALGFTQYFLGIPAGLVGLHIAGATLLWILTLRLQLALVAPVVPAADEGLPVAMDPMPASPEAIRV
jgi:cytochrome c oxidase assembly protein subunit 15